MPKSKRDKKISLTKTKKKGLYFKQNLVEDIRSNIEQYERLFVFSGENMRNAPLKDVRSQWKTSRFFFGKSKVMALALGKTKEAEQLKNLHKVSKQLKGQCGLLFTNEEQSKVIEWFSNFVEPEFARSGFKATRKVDLPAGQLMEFISSMEPSLRKLGLPSMVKNGKVHLREDYTVCTEGQVLTPSQAQILKLIGEYLAEFRITLKCVWSKDGTFEKLETFDDNNKTEQSEPVEMEEDDDDDEGMEKEND